MMSRVVVQVITFMVDTSIASDILFDANVFLSLFPIQISLAAFPF